MADSSGSLRCYGCNPPVHAEDVAASFTASVSRGRLRWDLEEQPDPIAPTMLLYVSTKLDVQRVIPETPLASDVTYCGVAWRRLDRAYFAWLAAGVERWAAGVVGQEADVAEARRKLESIASEAHATGHGACFATPSTWPTKIPPGYRGPQPGEPFPWSGPNSLNAAEWRDWDTLKREIAKEKAK